MDGLSPVDRSLRSLLNSLQTTKFSQDAAMSAARSELNKDVFLFPEPEEPMADECVKYG